VRVRFLEETATICPSCSNGCNIMACTYKNRIWRLIPRRNDAVNQTWMCDGGRLNYGFVADPARLRMARVGQAEGSSESDWEVAIAHAAAALDAFRQRHGGKALGGVVSPHLTNEENYCFGQLMRALGVESRAMAVRRGKFDDFLIKAEKAPNARGARELGLVSGDDDGLTQLLSACETGEIKGLYLCSDDLLDVVEANRLASILERMDLLIVHNLKLQPMLAKAVAVFPSTAFAEKDGTFTNHAGRVQRLHKALELPAGWLTEGEVFTSILNRLESRQEGFELPRIWDAMAQNGTAFAHLNFNEIDPYGVLLEKPG
jgi:NADH-quinone oxidoreductase subunit G